MDIEKERNLIKLKICQLVEKQQQYHSMTLEYEKLNKRVKVLNRSYLATHKEFTKVSHTIDHVR